MNSERDTIKNCALFLLACTTADTSKESERDDWPGENVKSVDALHALSHPPSLFFYLPFKCLTCWLCVVSFRNIAHCIQSRFSLLQKEAKTR